MNNKKFTNIDNKYLADAINWTSGLRYYIFTNDEGKTVYSFEDCDLFHTAINRLIELKQVLNLIN